MAKARMTKKGQIKLTLTKPEATAIFCLTGQFCYGGLWDDVDATIHAAISALLALDKYGYPPAASQGDNLRTFPVARGPLPVYEWLDA